MDPILYWNAVALEANRVSQTNDKKEQVGPALGSRALAIVHLAMYDAFSGIDPTAGLPYISVIDPPAPAVSAQVLAAAVAAAAHATLSALFPSQREYFNTKLAEVNSVMNPGFAYGLAAAAAILADRKDDPGVDATGYVPSLARGAHKVDPDNPSQGFYAPFYGARSKGFAITARHSLDAPPFGNTEYNKSVKQVRAKGIAPDQMGTLPAGSNPRTPNETLIGLYWGYDGSAGLGTPPRFYNQIIRRMAIARSTTPAQNARLFALVNTALADAGILAWEQKYHHNFWRPVVGIREHDPSMGMGVTAANTVVDQCDSSWLPLGAPATNALNTNVVMQKTSPNFPFNQIVMERPKNGTPPFPAYPSGHATFGAAALHMARLYFTHLDLPGVVPNPMIGNHADDTLFDGLDLVSDEMNGVNQDNRGTVRPRHVRNFPGGLWRMIEENGSSRVYLGVHWLFDAFVEKNGHFDPSRNIGGVPLGLKIAEDIFSHDMVKSIVPPSA